MFIITIIIICIISASYEAKDTMKLNLSGTEGSALITLKEAKISQAYRLKEFIKIKRKQVMLLPKQGDRKHRRYRNITYNKKLLHYLQT